VLATVPRDGIHGCTDLRCSVQAFDEVGGEALGGLKSATMTKGGSPPIKISDVRGLRRGFLGYRLPMGSAARLGEFPRPGSSISGRELLCYAEDHRLRLSGPSGAQLESNTSTIVYRQSNRLLITLHVFTLRSRKHQRDVKVLYNALFSF
jgi:hypothetical protein